MRLKAGKKIIEWLRRYLPAEICAIIGAVLGGMIVNLWFGNPILTALGGTWGDNTGYYGQILYQDIKRRKKKDEKINLISTLKVLRGIVFEFSVGEYLDSFVVRPAAMYFLPKILGNVILGIIVAKFAADVTFYIPTVISYEIKKKVLKD